MKYVLMSCHSITTTPLCVMSTWSKGQLPFFNFFDPDTAAAQGCVGFKGLLLKCKKSTK